MIFNSQPHVPSTIANLACGPSSLRLAYALSSAAAEQPLHAYQSGVLLPNAAALKLLLHQNNVRHGGGEEFARVAAAANPNLEAPDA